MSAMKLGAEALSSCNSSGRNWTCLEDLSSSCRSQDLSLIWGHQRECKSRKWMRRRPPKLSKSEHFSVGETFCHDTKFQFTSLLSRHTSVNSRIKGNFDLFKKISLFVYSVLSFLHFLINFFIIFAECFHCCFWFDLIWSFEHWASPEFHMIDIHVNLEAGRQPSNLKL